MIRAIQILWLVGLLAAAGCSGSEPTPNTPNGPNVLLVTIDTLRADHVGAYGSEWAETPTLDRLAARGTSFETAIAAAPLTLPSHGTILTGLYPPRHGARHNGIHRLDDSVTTLAERFQAAGFASGAIVGASVLGSAFGVAQGFDHFDDDFDDLEQRASAVGFPERNATQVSERAIAWLEQRGDGPFFLWLHYYDPHARYAPPEPYRTRFADRPYDGEIAYVDRELGRVIAHLEAGGMLGDTVVAVTSDHGEGLGEHAEATHSYFIYDSVLEVPLIFAGPGVPEGVRRAGVVSLASVAPTLSGLAGLERSQGLDGEDLASGWALAETPADAWAYAEGMASKLDHGWSPLYAIRSTDYSYIRAPRPELFDARADPGQLHNLLRSEPVASRHAGHVAEANERIDGVNSGGGRFAEARLPAETRAQIEALGYVVPVVAAVENGADPKDVHHLAELQFQVNAHYFEGRFDEGLALAERGLVELPESPMLHDMLARILSAKGEPAKAVVHARAAAATVPEWVGYWVQLADLELELGDIDAAVADYQRGIAVAPRDPDARAGSVWRCLRGELAEARVDAEVALAEGGDWPGRYEQIGNTWERCGQYDEALAVYEAGAKGFPDDGRLQMRLAIQWTRAGDTPKRDAALGRANEAARDPDLASFLAIAHAVRGEKAQADRLLRSVLAQHPEHRMAASFLERLHGRPNGEAAPSGTLPAAAAEASGP